MAQFYRNETLLAHNLNEIKIKDLLFYGNLIGFEDALSFKETLLCPKFNSSNEEDQQSS